MESRTIIFRADGGPSIGMGHFTRTLALAEMLNGHFHCKFATCKPTEHQIAEIENICHDRIDLPGDDTHFKEFIKLLQGDEIIVLDNYYFTTDYQRAIKAKGCFLVCIDDLHDKEFVADLVINHTDGMKALDYHVNSQTHLALGTEFALLRKNFLEQAKKERKRRKIKTVFVCFGGLDPKHLTQNAVNAVLEFDQFSKIIVVTGSAYKFQESFLSLINSQERIVHYHSISQQEMLDLMLQSDLGIVPASGILYEALATKLPVITGTYIENQKFFIVDLIKHSGIINCIDFSKDRLKNALELAVKNENSVQQINLFDGLSGQRILKKFRILFSDVFIITGANRGLGLALANTLLERNNAIVVSISRRISKEQERLTNSDKFFYISLDLSKDIIYSKLNVLHQIIKGNQRVYFFNNASRIKPISEISELNDEEIWNALKVNTYSPILLIKFLLSNFKSNSLSFVNITSGARKQSIENWSIYSSSKAFMYRFFEILKEENKKNRNFSFLSVDPGVIDTDMQVEIRSSDFPMKHYFDEVKNSGKLKSTTEAAKQILDQL